jgi:hypothetical protein
MTLPVATFLDRLTAGRAQMGTSLAFHQMNLESRHHILAPLAAGLVTLAALPAAAIACVAGGVWLAASPVADADATHYTVS